MAHRPPCWRSSSTLRDPAVFCHGRASAAGECAVKGFTYWPIGNALHPQTLRTMRWPLAGCWRPHRCWRCQPLYHADCAGLLWPAQPHCAAAELFSLGFPINMLAGLVCFATLSTTCRITICIWRILCCSNSSAERSLWRIAAAKKKQRNPRAKAA